MVSMIEQQYLTCLKENGYKCTPHRILMLSYFYKHKDRLISAKTMMQYLSKETQNISYDTIYRNLRLFLDIDVLKSTNFNGKQLFGLKNKPTHQNMFICTECQTITPLSFQAMEIVENSLKDYLINNHKFEVYGICPNCSSHK